MADILLGNVKGPQGNTGATGSQGPQGDAATITVGTVSTTAYGNTAQVTNSGTEQDAILDFVIPQGKPGEQTTRMGALTLDTITAQSADFPIPVVGETGSTVFGKIIKFFNSTVSALNSKLNISDVVNNLTSTSTTQPLSAAQGKALNDALNNKNWYNWISNMPSGEVDSGSACFAMVDVNTVCVALRTTGKVHAEGNLLLTIPTGYRPLVAFTTVAKSGQNDICIVSVSTNGQVTVWSIPGSTSGRLITSFSYVRS